MIRLAGYPANRSEAPRGAAAATHRRPCARLPVL